jgi:hypothetical protein
VRGGWLVGVVAVVVLGYITLNTLRTERIDPLPVGARLPPFAMPLASVASDDADARVTADACRVRGPDVLNLCELADGRPVVLAFVVTGAGDCAEQIDVLDRVAPRFPGVGFAAIAVRGDPDDLRALVRRRGWTVPVGYDHDGAVSIEYGLSAVCPLLTFGDRAGRVAGSSLGVVDDAALRERVEALVAGGPLP